MTQTLAYPPKPPARPGQPPAPPSAATDATMFAAPVRVDWSMINGRVVVDGGQLTTLDLGPIVERHNQIAQAMVNDDPIPAN